jgi:hypothetical protein
VTRNNNWLSNVIKSECIWFDLSSCYSYSNPSSQSFQHLIISESSEDRHIWYQVWLEEMSYCWTLDPFCKTQLDFFQIESHDNFACTGLKHRFSYIHFPNSWDHMHTSLYQAGDVSFTQPNGKMLMTFTCTLSNGVY